jgi:lysophospholipase L1-like esterase
VSDVNLDRITSRSRRLAPVALALAGLLSIGSAAQAATYPSSLAATGDSITMAYNTGTFPYTDNPSASWSTGTSSSVTSLYSRLLVVNPAISGKRWNDAKTGAKVADLAGQMTSVVSQHPDAVTVLIGANDVCASTEAGMTSLADFETRFRSAMATVSTGSPSTRIYVASIPNIYNLWVIEHGSSSARTVWSLFRICQSMLANPSSTSATDTARRARVLQREVDFNAVLARVCAEYKQCRWDGGAIFNTSFTTSDVTTRDYFHPTLAGQKKLAAAAWTAFFATP